MLLLYCDKHLRTSFLLFKLLQLQHDVQDCRKIPHHVFCPCHSHQHMFFMFANRLFSTLTYSDPSNLVCPVRKFGFFSCMQWLICAWKGLCKFVDEVEVWVAELAMHHHKEHKFKQMKLRYKLVSFPISGLLKRLFPCVPSSFMHWVPIYFLLCSWSFHCCLNLYPHALSKWSQ